ncbi:MULTISPECIES: MarR family winged helix-turn-helix transcriptional regulator [Rhizobium/Agrobacterium group]|jgi:DNA-binding MarR family transcriptional regulator|uniref:DNA-binding MarR family transcriptional regulator n=1 Tax=Rhizobium soli TaxID=424798 RepID=A0A7X0JJR9_9HYPH|nr:MULTISPECIES: MarR family transcriptional regulator [Rhizobium/Agrobacterium group]RYE69652.1 MAG: MarR family transcriptional regulator [Rhizobiaceae bacterium]KQQ38556.1 MarR family transcriptional regulator [Rhizobium sp. Leaf306]KQQ73354.1 MarR family transcriptional regulator [Rhizobium sp. Leaf321]MBB6508107.1 DNA-binding MarR family transcriptional regulator [Rhizobium soli]MBD8652293.1 MarR family transcriptional regulator [Rhizobium sp. CFBP 13726]
MAFDRSHSATYLANQLAKGFARSLQQRSSSLGFSPGQFPVLLELWQQDGLTQKQLLDKLEVEQATVANTLARMQRDGLIERIPHPDDKRAKIITLTALGRSLEARAVEAAAEADAALFSGFKRFERDLMIEYMRMILENARKL